MRYSRTYPQAKNVIHKFLAALSPMLIAVFIILCHSYSLIYSKYSGNNPHD